MSSNGTIASAAAGTGEPVMMRAASPARERRVKRRAGGEVGDDPEPHRAVGRGIRDVGEVHGEAVHRGVVEDRDVDPRPQGFAQRAAERGRAPAR